MTRQCFENDVRLHVKSRNGENNSVSTLAPPWLCITCSSVIERLFFFDRSLEKATANVASNSSYKFKKIFWLLTSAFMM